MAGITVFKGGGAGANKPFDFNLNSTLAQVRNTLVVDGFITADAANGPQYRFLAGKATKVGTNFANNIIPDSIEGTIPLFAALRNGTELVCTDVNATSKPDLFGNGTDTFSNRYLHLQIFLNNIDPEGKKQNDAIGATALAGEQLMMFTNVRSSSQNVPGVYDNVCVVVDGSVVGFNITSWGAAGYEYDIVPAQGPAIAEGLAILIGDTPNQYASTQLLRYQQPADNPRTIQIVGADSQSVPIGTNVVRFQKVTFRSRRIFAYIKDGVPHGSDQKQPAPQLAMMHGPNVEHASKQVMAHAVVGAPGDAIKPGGPVGGPQSQQAFGGGLSFLAADDWSEALGEIVVFFFVFRTIDDARRVIGHYNAPQPA
jgi:hypothetical protein